MAVRTIAEAALSLDRLLGQRLVVKQLVRSGCFLTDDRAEIDRRAL